MAIDEAKIREHMKESMRAKDADRTRVLRGLLAAIKNKAIEARTAELPESEIVTVVRRELKQAREALDFARQAGRADSVAEREGEIAVLEGYLPQQLDEDQLREIIAGIVAETGATSIGPIMKVLGERHAGRYDGKLASRMAKEALG